MRDETVIVSPLPEDLLDRWIDGPFKRFVSLRGIAEKFHSPRKCRPPCDGDLRNGGLWLYFKKIDVNDDDFLQSSEDAQEQWEEAHHGTSLNFMGRIAACGLSVGWSSTLNHSAIYLHPVKDARLCMGYAAYAHLFGDGVYVAIKFRVATMRRGRALRNRKTTLVRSKKVKQWLTYPGCYRVLGFWMHILTQHELFELYPTTMGPIISRRWQPEIELNPDDSGQVIHKRSKALAILRRLKSR